jgi:hypothetical protein
MQVPEAEEYLHPGEVTGATTKARFGQGIEHGNVGATLVGALFADAMRDRGNHKGSPLRFTRAAT